MGQIDSHGLLLVSLQVGWTGTCWWRSTSTLSHLLHPRTQGTCQFTNWHKVNMDASKQTSRSESFPWPAKWRKALPNPSWKQWKHRGACAKTALPVYICLQISNVYSKSEEERSIVSYCDHCKGTVGYVWFIYPFNVWCLVDPACDTSKPSWTACRETWGSKTFLHLVLVVLCHCPKGAKSQIPLAHWNCLFVSTQDQSEKALVRLASCS